MTKPIDGVQPKSGKCLIEKSEKSAGIDTKKVFTIIAGNTPPVQFEKTLFIKLNVLFYCTGRATSVCSSSVYCEH